MTGNLVTIRTAGAIGQPLTGQLASTIQQAFAARASSAPAGLEPTVALKMALAALGADCPPVIVEAVSEAIVFDCRFLPSPVEIVDLALAAHKRLGIPLTATLRRHASRRRYPDRKVQITQMFGLEGAQLNRILDGVPGSRPDQLNAIMAGMKHRKEPDLAGVVDAMTWRLRKAVAYDVHGDLGGMVVTDYSEFSGLTKAVADALMIEFADAIDTEPRESIDTKPLQSTIRHAIGEIVTGDRYKIIFPWSADYASHYSRDFHVDVSRRVRRMLVEVQESRRLAAERDGPRAPGTRPCSPSGRGSY